MRLAVIRRMNRLLENHFKAGHDLDNPKLVTDLRTQRYNLDAVLDSIPPYPVSTEDRLGFIVRRLVLLGQQQEKSFVSIATDIADAAAEVGSSATAAADRVVAALGTVRSDLAAAVARIEELIAAAPSAEDTAALEAALADLASADATIDSIEAAPAPEPTPEPTPEPVEEAPATPEEEV